MTTGFLAADRRLVAEYLPGLDEQLVERPLEELERPGSPAVEWFRKAGGPSLFVPEDLGGRGVGLRDGVRIQRALATRSPSLAVATTMHHFSVASMMDFEGEGTGMEWLVAEAVSRNSLLIASGAAESAPDSTIVRPQMTGRAVDKGILVSGSKKPCSLSRSMDLLFATVRVTADDGTETLALAVIPKGSPGLEVHPFWSSPVLAGAESDEVRLTDVFVPRRVVGELGPLGATTQSLRGAMVWFEVLIAACYVGVASALLERALSSRRAADRQLAAMAIDVEGAVLALERVADQVDAGGQVSALFGTSLLARFAAQQAVVRASSLAVEALGGGAFIGSPDVSYLHSAAACLPFHPPALAASEDTLVGFLRGAPVDLR
ncbi:hypothetical protein ALI22I_00750 [Saccharothrix sp. ALI-22-I]|uniref:acyl-CoA dehydrogenase family protein n=1 Tax=Saccharothrix sp. ALI-22-I TaxID=1933778 RepID=UPI00097BDA0F|nr:acyl-CoA dehydrogenase family protein [Saccharothrix sp. ALI-22-I]ONI92995.1 hypothetical protein ALI22I_00750 [Saccharothrix sp. ALI-22-I]